MQLAYIYQGKKSGLVRKSLSKRQNITEVSYKKCTNYIKQSFKSANLIWSTMSFNKLNYMELLQLVKERQVDEQYLILNKIEGINNLVNFNELYGNLQLYYKTQPQTKNYKQYLNHIISYTFILNGGPMHQQEKENQYQLLEMLYRQIQNNYYIDNTIQPKNCKKNGWVVKQINRKEQLVFNDLKELMSYLSDKPHNHIFTVQKQIEKPLLIQNKKCQFKLYVLLKKNQIYVYKNGYVKLYEQNADDSSHFNQNGQIISHNEFRSLLLQQNESINFEKQIIQKCINVIIDSYLSVSLYLNPNNFVNSFQLVEYSFLIDEDLRVWLTEVNENLSLETENVELQQLHPYLLEDILQLTLDQVLTKNQNSQSVDKQDLLYKQQKIEQLEKHYLPQQQQKSKREKSKDQSIVNHSKVQKQNMENNNFQLVYEKNKVNVREDYFESISDNQEKQERQDRIKMMSNHKKSNDNSFGNRDNSNKENNKSTSLLKQIEMLFNRPELDLQKLQKYFDKMINNMVRNIEQTGKVDKKNLECMMYFAESRQVNHLYSQSAVQQIQQLLMDAEQTETLKLKEIFMKILENNSIPRQMILEQKYIQWVQQNLCNLQMCKDNEYIRLYDIMKEFIVKYILNIKDYFYIPQESQINNTIKNYVIETNMIFNILLIIYREEDEKLKNDIQKKFLAYLKLEHWNMIASRLNTLMYKYVQFNFPDEEQEQQHEKYQIQFIQGLNQDEHHYMKNKIDYYLAQKNNQIIKKDQKKQEQLQKQEKYCLEIIRQKEQKKNRHDQSLKERMEITKVQKIKKNTKSDKMTEPKDIEAQIEQSSQQLKLLQQKIIQERQMYNQKYRMEEEESRTRSITMIREVDQKIKDKRKHNMNIM